MTSGRRRQPSQKPHTIAIDGIAISANPRVTGAVKAAASPLIVLLGGEAGLRCGEMIALEWRDVDLGKRQICAQRSDSNGQVTTSKGGRLRWGPL